MVGTGNTHWAKIRKMFFFHYSGDVTLGVQEYSGNGGREVPHPRRGLIARDYRGDDGNDWNPSEFLGPQES